MIANGHLAMGFPQPEQNLAFGLIGDPQFRQNRTLGGCGALCGAD